MQSVSIALMLTILPSLAVAQVSGPAPRSTGGAGTRPSADRYAPFAMSHLGDPSHGKALFFDTSRLACTGCHSVEADGREAKVGPNLYAIGDKFGRRELIEAIVSPSASIAVGYSSTTVRTRDGDVVQGILKESNDAGIALTQSDGTLSRLVRGEIRRAANQ